jgi:hypothetical protein
MMIIYFLYYNSQYGMFIVEVQQQHILLKPCKQKDLKDEYFKTVHSLMIQEMFRLQRGISKIIKHNKKT